MSSQHHHRSHFKLLNKKFRSCLESFCHLATQTGLDIVPYRDQTLPYFSALPLDQQHQTVTNFLPYLQAFRESLNDPSASTTRSDLQFLWYMLGKLQLRCGDGVFENLTDSDVIEIYNLKKIQVFRNLTFLRVSSYPLEDVLCRPYWELYHRPENVSQSIFKVACEVLEGQHEDMAHYNLPVHTVSELDSPLLYEARVNNRFLAPLYDSKGNVVSALNVVRVYSCEPRRDSETRSTRCPVRTRAQATDVRS